MVIVDINSSGFDVNEAREFVNGIEEKMGADNPSGLDLLHENLGDDLAELKSAIHEILSNFEGGEKLVWSPNASDMETIANLKDIIEQMGKLKGASLKWKNDFAVASAALEDAGDRKRRASFRERRNSFQKKMVKTTEQSAMHIACNCDEALTDARVLQTELAMKLGKLVSIPADANVNWDAAGVAVLLTKNALHDPATLASVYHAAIHGKPILPVCLIGRGYDHKTAPTHLVSLTSIMDKEKINELKALLADELDAEGNAATIESLQATLSSTLPQIIAVNWEPEAGKNQLEAAITTLAARLKKQLASMELAKNFGMIKLTSSSGGDSPNTGRSARRLLSSSRASPKSSVSNSSRSLRAMTPKSNGNSPTALDDLGSQSWQQEFNRTPAIAHYQTGNLGSSTRSKRTWDHGPVQV